MSPVPLVLPGPPLQAPPAPPVEPLQPVATPQPVASPQPYPVAAAAPPAPSAPAASQPAQPDFAAAQPEPAQPEFAAAQPEFAAAQPEPDTSLDAPAAEAFDEDEEFEATVVRPRSNTATKWKLIDLDGTAYALHLSNVFGRKPAPKDSPEKAQLVSLSDKERVLSRTHALLEVDGDTLYVTDLGSTNGTDVLDADDTLLLECEPQVRVAVPSGGSLSLGGRPVTFESPHSS